MGFTGACSRSNGNDGTGWARWIGSMPKITIGEPLGPDIPAPALRGERAMNGQQGTWKPQPGQLVRFSSQFCPDHMQLYFSPSRSTFSACMSTTGYDVPQQVARYIEMSHMKSKHGRVAADHLETVQAD